MDLDEVRRVVRDRQRKRRLDPAYHMKELESERQRRKNNPLHYAKKSRDWKRRKREEDPLYRNAEKAHSQKTYKQLRQALFRGYGSKCVCCGETELAFLEIDHVNGGGSKHFKMRNAVTLYRDIIRANFPNVYQILCSNCNRGRQRNGGICPHKMTLKLLVV